MLATILNHPEISTEAVITEFCAAFGPASKTVSQYFQLWESVYPNYSAVDQAEKINAKRKYGAGLYGPYYLLADEIFAPEAMRKAASLLETAQTQAANDGLAKARVEWLIKGFKQAELMLAVEHSYERAVDTGEKAEFLASYHALRNFRDSNADYDKVNFAGLSGDEPKWEKLNR
jgi:hypothetical protein